MGIREHAADAGRHFSEWWQQRLEQMRAEAAERRKREAAAAAVATVVQTYPEPGIRLLVSSQVLLGGGNAFILMGSRPRLEDRIPYYLTELQQDINPRLGGRLRHVDVLWENISVTLRDLSPDKVPKTFYEKVGACVLKADSRLQVVRFEIPDHPRRQPEHELDGLEIHRSDLSSPARQAEPPEERGQPDTETP